MSPKARSSRNLPAHIQKDRDRLPSGVWFVNTGKFGHWRVEWLDEGKKKTAYLCHGSATLTEIHQAKDAFSKEAPAIAMTFRLLSEKFQTTRDWQTLAQGTKTDYLNCHNAISGQKTKTGLLGDQPITHWEKSLILRYLDKRSESSASRAGKELAYIKRLFAWAFERDYIGENISLGIKKPKVVTRSHYVEHQDYYFMLETVKASDYDYLFYVMELAYLCLLRKQEILDLTLANELPEGLLIKRRKGSRSNIMQWTDRLQAVWTAANKRALAIYEARKQPVPIKKEHRKLMISARTGDPITPEGLSTAWQRGIELTIRRAETEGKDFTPFWLHDLKKKGISDYEGNKIAASGHRSQSMMSIYDLSVPIVKPVE